ncbi:restriction endonuclease subunit S [Vibrio cholerae]|uniref:restriction endonuclease subunit S n=1 Tax=Vibrio cholerae TaxID=666 RepID=UPI00155E7CFF|nr:restriction endonuclease subunit S [Vibrio cholerae]EGR4402266.1 restriction endonuclease subunit S [Vibrio cholerae]ELZ1191461.1 restriction endonuclease subunit S [Vibrio cholerae]NOE10483.1 restriction endonuclease subunit S [Vibrio cholerae]GHY38204.1 Type I restriction-modification system specificity [Vibrio cholerae]HDL9508829.1 restriction endonuclease subunit S [Vibrio cholerae]
MSWSAKSLDELGTVSRGRSRHRPRDAAHLYGGPYPFVQTGDVKRAGLYLTEYSQTYSDEGLAQSKLWPSGTLCITIAANIADTSILAIDACFPDSVIGFIPDPKKSDARFIKYLFDAVLKLQYRQVSQGAAQDNLSQGKLLALKFSVPDDVNEQIRIADFIATYDDLIENNRRRIQLLEESARLLYQEWFVRLRFPGHEQAKIIDGVPEGWERTTADKVMNILSGGTPKTKMPEFWNGGIPFFTPKDAKGLFTHDTEKTITGLGLSKCNSHLYPKYTVFITARGTVGKLSFAQRPMAMNQSCYALIAKDGISQEFLYSSLKASIDQFKARASGAVFDAIVVDTFKDIPFLIPGPALRDEFTKQVKLLFNQVDNLSIQNIKLAQARDLLLPKLMSGELAV